MIVKTRIKQRVQRKSNPTLVSALRTAMKNKNWLMVAHRLSGPTRKYVSVNLEEIDAQAKEGDTIVVVGKVLGVGAVTKKMRVCALGFSATARDKLARSKSEIVSLIEEIEKNPKADGVRVIS